MSRRSSSSAGGGYGDSPAGGAGQGTGQGAWWRRWFPGGTSAADGVGWRRWLQRGALGGLLLALLTAPLWGPPALGTLDFFRVRRVEFYGLRYTDANELTALLALDSTASVWMPTDSLHLRVMAHPMITSARVSRSLPATLVVTVDERVAVALVPSDSGLVPVDALGAALPIDPSVAAVDAPVAAAPDSLLLDLLARVRTGAPELWSRLSDARRDGPHDLRFSLTNLELRTRDDVTVARLSDILPVEADLARRRLRAVELDLRFRDQVIVRLP